MTSYWEAPPKLKLHSAYWVDPLPEVQSMLSSDLISFYNHEIGVPGMIDPFDVKNLKPAAYELTLGPNYLLDGEERTLTSQQPWLELPPNSIVFVSMNERLLIPHYIVARFDLAIEFIYQGILLGTGPQVDPGFQGVLSCPLHNISDASVHLQLGYPFAKIDFAKSSSLRIAREKGELDSITDEDGLYRATLSGKGGEPVHLFNRHNRWRQPIYSTAYAGQKRVRSSLSQLDSRITGFGLEISRFEIEVGRLRRFGLAGAIVIVLAIVTVLVTLAQLDRSYTDAKVTSVERKSESAQALNAVRREIGDLRREVRRLRQRLAKASP